MRSLEESGRNMSTMLCMLNLLSDLFEIITPSHDLMCLNENMNPQNIPFKMQIITVLADDDKKHIICACKIYYFLIFHFKYICIFSSNI